MIRQKQRKTVEELYGGKSEAAKSQITTTYSNSTQKTGRTTERDCGYIISSNTPYNGPLNSTAAKSYNAGKETYRRKSTRPTEKLANESYCEKGTLAQATALQQAPKGASANIYDNKNYTNYKDSPTDGIATQQHHQHHKHHQHKHRQSAGHDEDKDDDTDEFFVLIRRTVESAIGKSISELLNRNFKDLSSKVERFSAELKNTNALLSQMQNDVNNKIIHYGEENSRHFRYLCMKSEYDKMFYQHQTLIANATPRSSTNIASEIKKPEKRRSAPRLSNSTPKLHRTECNKPSTSNACACRSHRSKTPSAEINETQQRSSEDISQKSSEVGMREVLEHIQKFCTQMKLNDLKSDQGREGEAATQNQNFIHPDDLIKIDKEIFLEEDEVENDEWDVSSDEMTPRIIENKSLNYGGTTARGATTQRGFNGAGDG